MEILYIPWRKRYKRQAKSSCPFCASLSKTDDRTNLIIKRFETCALFLCLHPYNAGHVLIIPYKHTGEFAELSEKERHEMVDVMDQAISVLYKKLCCNGVNAGINLGDGSAGGSIPEHLHMHVVPRFFGDTNFLPLMTSTRLITRDLMEVYDQLVEAFNE